MATTADLVIRQGDTYPALASTILDPSLNVLNLTGATVTLAMRALTSNAQVALTGAASIVSPSAGTVQFVFSAADTATAGLFMAEWHITLSGGQTYTWPNDGYLTVSVEQNITSSGGALLVGLPDVKDYLGMPSSDRTRDAKLVRFIRSITPVVEHICGPILLTQREEWHDGGQTFIRLRRRPSSGYQASPVMNLIACSEYRGPIEYPLTIVADPAHGSIYSVMLDTFGFVTRRAPGGSVMAFPGMPRSVHVLYQSGQSVVPPNVYEGALELIRLNYQDTQLARNPALGATPTGGGIAMMGFFVPGRVKELLSPSRRAPSVF